MTKIVCQSHEDPLDYAGGLHVLTFAEEGFAPLNIHGRRFGISRDILSAFSSRVNQRDEVGTLWPQAPISAVPQSCIRDTTDPTALLSHLREFIPAIPDDMKTTTLVLDFSTPRLPPHVEYTISKLHKDALFIGISQIVVICN
jgi:hypothetical protein